MWPWESAVFAYLCYSPYVHLHFGERPAGAAVLVAGGASILPDVIDKPLNWQFGVFRNGYALGHSIFFGLLVLLVAVVVGRRFGRSRLGLALGIGFVSHNLGDALEHMDDGVWFGLKHMLWPVFVLPPDRKPGFGPTLVETFREYLGHLLALSFTPYFALVGAIFALGLALWVYDGFPVLREVLAYTRRQRVRE